MQDQLKQTMCLINKEENMKKWKRIEIQYHVMELKKGSKCYRLMKKRINREIRNDKKKHGYKIAAIYYHIHGQWAMAIVGIYDKTINHRYYYTDERCRTVDCQIKPYWPCWEHIFDRAYKNPDPKSMYRVTKNEQGEYNINVAGVAQM